MYRVSGKDLDQEFKKKLSQFMSAMKIVIASNKSQYVISLKEVKKVVTLFFHMHF